MRNYPPKKEEGRTCVRPSWWRGLHTPSPGRSEGRRSQLGVAVRAAPQAKPLCQP